MKFIYILLMISLLSCTSDIKRNIDTDTVYIVGDTLEPVYIYPEIDTGAVIGELRDGVLVVIHELGLDSIPE